MNRFAEDRGYEKTPVGGYERREGIEGHVKIYRGKKRWVFP